METKKAQINQEESKETQKTAMTETTANDQKAIRKEKIKKIKKIGILAGISTALVGVGVIIGKVIFGGSADSEDGMNPIVTDFVDDEPNEE